MVDETKHDVIQKKNKTIQALEIRKYSKVKLSHKIREKITKYSKKTKNVWRVFIAKILSSSVSSLEVARLFSWIFLILIIIFSVFLSVFVGTTTRSSLIKSQESYTLLLAENMNTQIFRRFTLPVAYASGRVALSEPDQYRLLDEVVDSLMHGLRIESIRIFDINEVVAFSTNKEDVRNATLSTPGIMHAFTTKTHHFEVMSSISFLEALFTPNLPDGSFILRTVYPLTIDFELGPFKLKEGEEAPTLGALELLQDVTSVYKGAIQLQWTILIGFTISILILFGILQIVARAAERIIKDRIKQNKQLEKELYQSEKLASMGRMVASIAHEVRNPLGIIKSSSEYLLNGKDADSKEKKLLGAIFDEASRLGVTVNDFLDYAKPRDPGKKIADIVSAINKVWVFLQPSFEQKKIRVNFQLPEKLEIIGDEDSLYRAVYNLFINAEQAMKDGGTFNIFGFVTKSGETKLSFIDNGCGFPNNTEKILDPFFTTKETGTGLGLPIVQSIVKSHQGKLMLSNSDSGGAIIEIIFPKKKLNN